MVTFQLLAVEGARYVGSFRVFDGRYFGIILFVPARASRPSFHVGEVTDAVISAAREEQSEGDESCRAQSIFQVRGRICARLDGSCLPVKAV